MCPAAEPSRPAPGWVAEIVEQGADAQAAFAADGTLVYLNRAAEDLLAQAREVLTGTNAFDLVHPEDLDRAATTVTSMAEGARPLPGLIRLRRGDGEWTLYEVTASTIALADAGDGSPGPLTVVTIRDTALQDAQWRFLTALSAGAALHDCFTVLADGLSNSTDGPMGIAYDTAAGRRVAGPLAPVLSGVDGAGRADQTPGTPWTAAARSGRAVTLAVDLLPSPWREMGEAAGAAACVAVPVSDPAGPRPALIVQWPPHAAMAEVVAHALVRRPRQAVSLALDRRDAQRRLEHLAHHDGLTGLVNRSHFFTILGELARSGEAYGVLYVDLDRFKPVNDRLGHVIGDHTLVVCARRLERAAGPEAVVARLGGDEFAISLAGADEAELGARAAAVVAALGQPFRIGDHLVEVGASVGVARTGGGDAPDAVVAAADGALYRAKREGRSTWRQASVVDLPPAGEPGWAPTGGTTRSYR